MTEAEIMEKLWKDMTLAELSQEAREKRVRIEINLEPNGCGQTRESVTVEPWEPYEPTCPHGMPIVYVKGKKAEEQ